MTSSKSILDPNLTTTDGVVDRVTKSLSRLSQAERRIGELLLSDPMEFSGMNVRKIAGALNISEPTVVRFCRNVGYEGFKNLKFELLREVAVRQAISDAQDAAQPAQIDPDGLSEACYSSAVSALESAYSSIDQQAVLNAAKSVASAQRVVIFGLGGSSAAMAMELHSRLFRLGITCTPTSDSYLQRMSAATLDVDDVAIFVSATGRPRALLDCVELAKYYGAKSIGILPSDSLLAREVDVCIHIELSQKGVHLFQPNPMRFAQLLAIDFLASKVAQVMGDKAENYLNRTRTSVALMNGVTAQQPIGD